MKYQLISLLPEKWRNKLLKIKIFGLGNKVVDENGRPILRSNLKIKIRGNNNRIVISKFVKIVDLLKIGIIGNNCFILIKDGVKIEKLKISFEKSVENATVEIGRNTTIEGMRIVQAENDTSVIIGDDCMVSYDVLIYNTDAHPVYDIKSGYRVNCAQEVRIGKHCWVGMRAQILKNVQIGDNCIVGSAAVVTGKFEENNCVVAGNPAKICKRGINWDY